MIIETKHTAEPQQPEGTGTWRKVVRAVLGHKAGYVGIIVFSLAGIYLFGYRDMAFFLVPSSSMEPTLLRMDHLVTLDETIYHRGDIVVLYDPEEPGGYIVKRIVAVGGDTAAVFGKRLYLNSVRMAEPYIREPPEYTLPPTHVPAGHVLLLGDNRNNSEDGHLWPCKTVSTADLIGKVRFIYYPYHRMGRIRGQGPIATEGSFRKDPRS